MKKTCLILLILLSFLFLFPQKVIATILFEDNFDDGDISDWTVVHNSQYGNSSQPCLQNGNPTSWTPSNNGIGIKINGPACVTEIIPNQFLSGNMIEYTISFNTTLKGDLFSDRHFLIKYGDPDNWYNFKPYGTELNYQKLVNPIYIRLINSYPFVAGGNYNFKIRVSNTFIELYINQQLVWKVDDSPPYISNGKVGFQASVGANPLTEVWFDNVMVCSLDDPCGEAVPTSTPSPTETPTPTSTLTPTNKIPVIIIPGHGACFNREAIIDGEENVAQEKWKILPFVHEYDGLINSIKNSEYQLNKDLFVFCYDWRKKIDQTANVLKDFIVNKVLADRTDTEQTKIVGHSMGGLVGRSFAQKYDGANLDRLITVGSPHKGVIQSYFPWEGGEPYSEKNLQWLTWQLLIQAQKKNFTTNVETIRKVAPSTQDLLPTFNFLKDKNTSAELNFRALNQKNEWLYQLNNSLPDPPFLEKVISIVGEKGGTPAWYKVIPRSWLDKLLGKWEDGKPVETKYEIGDLTVLEKSAQIPADPSESLNLDHGELIRKTEGIRKILELINIPETEIKEGAKFEFTPSLIFALGSPTNLIVTAPDGTTYSGGEEKLVFIPQAVGGIYNVQIIPDSFGGNFRLFIGQETEGGSLWKEINETINTVPLNFQVNFDPEKPIENPILDSTGKTYLDLASEKILLLKNDYRHPILNKILKAIDDCRGLIENNKNFKASQKVEKIIEMIFQFRKDNSIPKARNISFEAIELLEKAYEIMINNSGQSINPSEIKAKIKSTQNLINSTERTLKILEKKGKLKPANGISFELAQSQFEKAKRNFSENSLPLAKIQLSVTNSLLQESLIN